MSRLPFLVLASIVGSVASAAEVTRELPTAVCAEDAVVTADVAVGLRSDGTLPFDEIALDAVSPATLSPDAACTPRLRIEGVRLDGVDPAAMTLDTWLPLAATPFFTSGHTVQGTTLDAAGMPVPAVGTGTVVYAPLEMIAYRKVVSWRPYEEAVFVDIEAQPVAFQGKKAKDAFWVPTSTDTTSMTTGSTVLDGPCIEVWLRPEHPWCEHCLVDLPDATGGGEEGDPYTGPDDGGQCL